MIDPIWDKIHSERPWLTYPQEEMFCWAINTFGARLQRGEKITIIDLGCGQGSSTLYLTKYGFRMIGVDGSKNAINKLNETFKEMNWTPTGICSELSHLPFADNTFDAAIDICSICHNADYMDLYNEAMRVIKPGGWLFSTVPGDETTSEEWKNRGFVKFFSLDEIKTTFHNRFEKVGIAHKALTQMLGTRSTHWLVTGTKPLGTFAVNIPKPFGAEDGHHHLGRPISSSDGGLTLN